MSVWWRMERLYLQSWLFGSRVILRRDSSICRGRALQHMAFRPFEPTLPVLPRVFLIVARLLRLPRRTPKPFSRKPGVRHQGCPRQPTMERYACGACRAGDAPSSWRRRPDCHRERARRGVHSGAGLYGWARLLKERAGPCCSSTTWGLGVTCPLCLAGCWPTSLVGIRPRARAYRARADDSFW